ncbi:MAG: hypothetical protein ACI8P2_002803 [Candidatus Latescibacterota bacterium]
MLRSSIAHAIVLVCMLCASPSQALVGDINCDGQVDFTDFFMFSDNFGKEGTPSAACAELVGDFDCNHSVDFTDFFVFSDNFGKEGALSAACGTVVDEVVSGDSTASSFHAPQVLADMLATTRTVTWTVRTGSLSDLTRLSLGVEGTQDLLVIDDSVGDYAAVLKIESDMTASDTHSNDALLKAAFKLIEVGIDTYMLVSAKHANYAVDFATINGVQTLVMRDYRSFFIDTSTAAFLTFSFATAGTATHVEASARHVYSAAAGGFVADAAWVPLNVAIDGATAILTTETGTAFTAFSLYMPTLDQDIPFDFNPTQVARVSNGEFLATSTGSDRLAGSIKDVLAAYKDQVASAGVDASTTAAADAMLATIESTLIAEGASLRYPVDFYNTVRANMLSRKVQVADYYDVAIGQHSIPYVYFTNEVDGEGVHHPFMVIASYGVTEGMVNLWDVPRPPGDGTPGTGYDEQTVTRNAGNQGYFAKVPMRDYGEVESLTENVMVNDLASDTPGAVDFTHLNYTSTSATGIAIDGVMVYPALNNTLNIAASAGEISSVGIHSGRGLGVHYHADAHSAAASGLNLYNAADYEGYAHPPIISFGFDGVAGYGRYVADDTTSAGATEVLDEWGGHEHGVYAYHYHAEAIDATAVTQGPGGSSTAYTAHMLPPKGAWRGRINAIPEFWDGTAPAYGGRPGVYQGIESR